MDIVRPCVGLHAIDLTLHAPYQSPPSMGSSSWASASAGAIGRGLFTPNGDVKGALWSAPPASKAWMNAVTVWLKCEWLACVCMGVNGVEVLQNKVTAIVPNRWPCRSYLMISSGVTKISLKHHTAFYCQCIVSLLDCRIERSWVNVWISKGYWHSHPPIFCWSATPLYITGSVKSPSQIKANAFNSEESACIS